MISDIVPVQTILQLSLCIVGITQMVKTLIQKAVKGRVSAVLSIIISLILCFIYFIIPADVWNKVVIVIMSIAVSTLFYDTVYQLFKSIIEGVNNGLRK